MGILIHSTKIKKEKNLNKYKNKSNNYKKREKISDMLNDIRINLLKITSHENKWFMEPHDILKNNLLIQF